MPTSPVSQSLQSCQADEAVASCVRVSSPRPAQLRARLQPGRLCRVGPVLERANRSEIDLEVRRIIETAETRARQVLELRREALEEITARLIDRETIDAAEPQEILKLNSRVPSDPQFSRRRPAYEDERISR